MEDLFSLFSYFLRSLTEEKIRTIATYATLIAVLVTLAKTWRNNQKITVVAVNAETGESLEVARLPRFQMTRGEVLGIMRLQAGGHQLDTSCFKWDEKIPRKARFEFPPHSYALLTGKAGTARNA